MRQMKAGGTGFKKVLMGIGVLAFGATLAAGAPKARTTKVLMVTGDWKTQPWYQDVWMKGKGAKLFRGRFIAAKVNAVAPGKFEFTEITNYAGQEYLDADYLSQFDVLLLGDIVGWSLNPRFEAAVGDFVRKGGGVIYCASWKWHCTMPKGTGLADVLPAEFPINDVADDWAEAELATGDKDFKAAPVMPEHPAIKGLDWTSVPLLSGNFKMTPKKGSDVLLKAPSGAPVLVAWKCGEGRTMLSSSIFANDELSEKFGNEWRDFGRFYAQAFEWLGAASKNTRATLKDATANVAVTLDFGKLLNKFPAAIFSIHGAHDCPGFVPLQGQALEYFNALNPEGGLARFAANCEPERGRFDFSNVDRQLGDIQRLGLEPLALFGAYSYGEPKWIWADGSGWSNPSDQAVALIVEEVAKFLEHVNGRKGDPAYRPNVKYIEICNEPPIDTKTIDGFAKFFKAVAAMVHQNFPGVKIGALGGYEIPYVKLFIDRCGADTDWISRHPYGWTGEMIFKMEDEYQAYARSKGLKNIQFIVTEWDFWIQGRPKFDYMMKRYFEAVKRTDLIGTLHYRFGMYAEPVYLFGVLWSNWGQDQGAGPANTPMHDAYDAFWIFRDFRGGRVATEKAPEKNTSPKIVSHILADATRDGEKLNAVLYYDWAYDGTGFKDYARGVNYAKVRADVKLAIPPAGRERTLTISRATGEGYEVMKKDVKVPAGQKEISETVEIAPLTAVSLTVQ